MYPAEVGPQSWRTPESHNTLRLRMWVVIKCADTGGGGEETRASDKCHWPTKSLLHFAPLV